MQLPDHILNIPVGPALLSRWSSWLAPQVQPFFLTDEEARAFGLTGPSELEFSPELRDTFQLWKVAVPGAVLLDERAFSALPPTARAGLLEAQIRHRRGAVEWVEAWRDVLDTESQAGGERFVWWPSLLVGRERQILERLLSRDRLPCQRGEVPETLWAEVSPILPRARELAGTFAAGSGPNCFGTVMAAAGVLNAEREWMQREPFEAWLSANTVVGGPLDTPGSVLVWRSEDGLVQHAALSLGGGFALHKPSQCWDSPRQVLALSDVLPMFADDGTLNVLRLRAVSGWGAKLS
ncbi:hypothetical protein [Deinococcus detaillensis]|uniref:hypothetical protein n=1 Tax=Deinococcus detaillensis TaxID=2592048 RepID=UPI00163DCFBA|nr:hypothetical protein [Deinococcus detaillensis]